jgi:hypothetical protein
MSEILTCSGFLLHETLKKKWIEDGNYMEYHNTVNFTTNYNTAEQRLNRLNRIEEVFIEIGITHSVYNRGLYHELINRKDYDGYNHVYNIDDCKIPEKLEEYKNSTKRPLKGTNQVIVAAQKKLV